MAHLNVAIVTNRLPSPPIGGVPRFTHTLARALSVRGAKVTFLFTNASPRGDVNADQATIENTLAATLNYAAPTTWTDVSLSTRAIRAARVRALGAARPLFSETPASLRRFDLIVLAGSPMMILDSMRLGGALVEVARSTVLAVLFPLVEIEFYGGRAARDAIAAHLAALAKLVHSVVVPSRFVARELAAGKIARAPIVIPHGLLHFPSPRSAVNSSHGVITVLRGGAFAKHKHLDVVIKAWELVRCEVPDAVLTVVGASDPSFKAPGVIQTGVTSERERTRLLTGSRLFVSSSLIEAFGYSFLEALAHGLPCIGVHSTAIPELIRHRINGLLVEGHTNPAATEVSLPPSADQLASALILLLKDRLLYQSFQRETRASVASYTADAMCDAYESTVS